MSYPEKAETMVLLRAWMQLHSQTEKLAQNIGEIFGHSPENLFFETTWALFDAYTSTLSALIGDGGAPRGESWLVWFWSENAMGANKHKAGYGGKLKAVKNLDDLYALIAEGRDEI